MSENFELKKIDGKARAGILKTQRGEVLTPVFMPVATRGAIRGAVGFDDLEKTESQICLGNTYHLYLRPGDDLVAKFGGLHKFMNWNKPILTDSGGFQVFSIQKKKITEEGVFFNSHIDGKRFYLDAEKSIDIQHNLGADIIMAFDECPPNVPNFHKIRRAVEKTTRWAKKSLEQHFKKFPREISQLERPQIFGIIQGGCFPVLRDQSMKEITNMDFDGFALGGLAVGETSEAMYKVLDEMVGKMPENKPRYLMGVGTPENLLEAVERGIDMFDCVLPMRNARHGTLYTWEGKIRLGNAKYKADEQVLCSKCKCEVCANKKLSRAYLHHLYRVEEELGKRYLTIHNIAFYQQLMQEVRKHILAGDYSEWKKEVLESWGK
jgi:queuine tRNA-ribosyltransferase